MTTLDLTRGTARELVAPADVPTLRAAGVLVEDPRRERPRWFDGRFLAARDLIREQQYLLAREADLGRAAGSGVAAGLHIVENPAAAQTFAIDAGHGLTPAGELVLLPRRLQVALADIAVAEQLSARFGLGRRPSPPLRSRTGLFVLALRPVEYTANPVGAYPSSITGQRSVEDGDVIEATAVVLVPWADDGAADALAARRGRVARELFVAGAAASGVSANLLPLAMLALQNNAIVWVDEAMVRRELGADRGDLPGLGFSPRALRLAHLMQYQDHLADVQRADKRSGYAATTYFPALPPAGPLPPGVIDPGDFTQSFFPAEIDVDFTPIPEDELPALVEDALALQPIDLQAPSAALDSTAVMIVAPVPRAEWRAVMARLTTVTRPVKPAAPNLLAQRKPFEILLRLRLPRVVPTVDVTNPSDAEWQRLARLPSLWFVRRRQLALRDDYAGAWQPVAGVDERAVEGGLRVRLAGLGLGAQFDALVGRASPAAAGTLTNLLASPRYAESPALTAVAIGSLSEAARAPAAPAATAAATAGRGAGAEGRSGAGDGGGTSSSAADAASLDQAAVLKVASQFGAAGAGAGIERLERAAGSGTVATAALQRLASGGEWRKLDAGAAGASPATLGKLARKAFGAPADPAADVPAPTTPAAAADGAAPAGSTEGEGAAPVDRAATADAAPPVAAGATVPADGTAIAAATSAAPAATVPMAIDPAPTPGQGSVVVSPTPLNAGPLSSETPPVAEPAPAGAPSRPKPGAAAARPPHGRSAADAGDTADSSRPAAAPEPPPAAGADPASDASVGRPSAPLSPRRSGRRSGGGNR